MPRGIVRVAVWARLGTAERLAALVGAESDRRYELLAADPRWVTDNLPAAERAAVRAREAAWLDELRERGELLDTEGAALAWGVRAELTARGWDRDWPAAPGATDLAGRWPGSMSRGYPERIAANLPVRLVEQVRAACWHTSAHAIAELRAWRERNPGRIAPGTALYVEYAQIADRITSPGEIWRQGLDHALAEGDDAPNRD